LNNNVAEPLVSKPSGASTGLFINPFVEPQNAPKFVQPSGKAEIPKGKNLHQISAPETLSCVYNNNSNNNNNSKNNNKNQKHNQSKKQSGKSKENDPKLQYVFFVVLNC
jgi:hypothetical protein